MHSHLKAMKGQIREALDLAEALGASATTINYAHSSSISVTFVANHLKECQASESSSIGISLIMNGRRGAAGCNAPENLQAMVHRAADFARNGAISHFDKLPQPAPIYPHIRTFSKSILDYTPEKMLPECKSLVERLLALDKTLVINSGSSAILSESLLMNSAGLESSSKNSMWTLGADFQKTTGTDMLFGGEYRAGVRLDSFYDPEAIFAECEFDLRHAATIVKADSGVYPIFVPPDMLGRFLSPLLMGINGRNVFKGTSPLKDMLHTQCFSPSLSILDDPHRNFDLSSARHDDAGIPTQKRLLVENGVLNTFLYDYDTAALAGVEPTGNSGCAPYTSLVTPGKLHSSELLASIKKGIYVRQLLGFGQTNLANGDFSANLALGFLIEDGKIVGRVKDAMISANIFTLLKGELQFSCDTEPYYSQPYAIIPGVSLKA